MMKKTYEDLEVRKFI